MPAKKILVLAVNPKDSARLRLDEEVRQVKEALKLSAGREDFEVVSEWAVRSGDLHRHLLSHKPQIVHFSGHGLGQRGLAVEDKNGRARAVSNATLDRLFRLCGGVECVLLNACHSAKQLEAIGKHVDCVIGMNQAIGDRAAIRFAEGFYDGLGYGREYAEAYEFGLLAIEEEELDEAMTPVLRVKEGKGEGGTGKGEEVAGEEREKVKGQGEKGAAEQAGLRKATVVPQVLPKEQLPGERSERIFISYKRDVGPDEPVALALYEALRTQHEVFIDQAMLVGTRWAEQIEAELRRMDVLIVLLSEQAVGSEMVQQEVALAHEIAEDNGGRPRILPVRLAYREPFEYPLSVYLDPINWAFWQGEADTAGLIDELRRAIAGGDLSVGNLAQKKELLAPAMAKGDIPRPSPAAQPGPASQRSPQSLELPEGTMDLESGFYVARPSDAVALETVRRQGVTITIKGPRQMGKSSLLNRVMAEAVGAGKQVAFLDFQLFDRAALQDADEFYQQFCFWLTDELADELAGEDCFEGYWNKPLSHTQRCTRYVGRHILKSLDAPLVLAMDEVERIFDTPFRNDFWLNRCFKELAEQDVQ